ncbi:MAG: dTDP-glucose 4,6-dehydratase [Solirubrobacterales bacterium]
MRLLVAGGAGFIGSGFVHRRLEQHPDDNIRVLDKLTYAGRRENLAGLSRDRVDLILGDIRDREIVAMALRGCDAVVNFAAESHVDRSIESPGEFIETDVYGVYVLLDAAREAGIRHLQVSTDEVYGSIDQGSFTEESPLDPSSPYSASKAGGDLIVSAFHQTYGADCLIVRGSNNYGPRQYPEKLIPLAILNALHGDPVPVYGDGAQVRNWIHVDDFCAAIDAVLERGEAGQAYNAGGPDELANLDVVRRILELTGAEESLIEFVADRLGHDRRYSLASRKLEALGWQPQVRFAEGIERVVAWYRDSEAWWGPLRSGEYRDYYERRYGRQLGEGQFQEGSR